MIELKFLNFIVNHYKEIRVIELARLYDNCTSVYNHNNTDMGNILDILKDYQNKEGKNVLDNDNKLERSIMRSFFVQKGAGDMTLLLENQDDAVVTIYKRVEEESEALYKYIKNKILIKTRKEFFNKGRCIDIKEVKKDDKSIKLRILNNDSSKFDVAIKIAVKGDKTGRLSFSIKTSFSNVFSSNGEKIDSPSEAKILNLI